MQARGGQQQAEEELKNPKAVLGVDDAGNALLVTGPPFIYEQILKIVQKLDSPELSESSYMIMPLEGRNAEILAKSLRASLGEKIELSGVETPQQGQAETQNQQQANRPGAQQAQQQMDARNQMMQALQQQMNRQNRGQGQRGNRGNQNQGRRGGDQGGQRGGDGNFQFVPGGGR
jgi:type II secretory pathway component GspD/PulD (secretin)